MTENRRSAHRHSIALPAKLTLDGETHDVVVQNLSLGGAQFIFGQRLTIGERVRILFHIPVQDDPIDILGTVRWSGEDSLGVQFEGLEPRAVWALNKYLESLE